MGTDAIVNMKFRRSENKTENKDNIENKESKECKDNKEPKTNEYIPQSMLINSVNSFYYTNLLVISKINPKEEWGDGVKDLVLTCQIEYSNSCGNNSCSNNNNNNSGNYNGNNNNPNTNGRGNNNDESNNMGPGPSRGY